MNTSERRPCRRALISVSNKTGVGELAKALSEAGVQIVSTGATAAAIEHAGVQVSTVEHVTGSPEILGGRVKTLHPRIHAAILADPAQPDHAEHLAEHGIEPFDLVIVNLYPFTEVLAAGATTAQIIENIDIGGPTLIRGAAKNHAACAVVVNPRQYPAVIEAVRSGGFTAPEREQMAARAFALITGYDCAISQWMNSTETPLRYGENPLQAAHLRRSGIEGGTLASATIHGGKEMSFNNYVDADAAIRAAFDHDQPCVAVIKHANPCGIGTADRNGSIAEAHAKAHATDPLSAYGGVIAANRAVSVEMAQQITSRFTEVVVAPGYDDGALEILRRKPKLRILEIDGSPHAATTAEERQIWGGTLVQTPDTFQAPGDDPRTWQLVAGPAVDEAVIAELAFAWRCVRAVRSNAIVLTAGGATVGIGMGQVNRLDSCRLAVQRANAFGEERARGAVAASDAFFPFADGPQILIDAGVRAVVQPGGSIRDDEVIQACEQAGVSMVLTGTRHFTH